jgi:hypothetical protein
VPGGQIGEIADKGKVLEKQYQPVDTDVLKYCWRHSIELTSDWQNPSPEDAKKLAKIKLKEGQVTEIEADTKKVKIIKFRFCPKCFITVAYTKPI